MKPEVSFQTSLSFISGALCFELTIWIVYILKEHSSMFMMWLKILNNQNDQLKTTNAVFVGSRWMAYG